jgi:hypothetical protein
VGRLAALAPVWVWRLIWSVGLDHQPIEWQHTQRFEWPARSFKRNRPSK